MSELVVDRKTGEVRQAGASSSGEYIQSIRRRAEQNLFYFAKGILGCWWLTPTLHRPICEWLQRIPPRRKMLMIPRGHGKTTLVGQCLPIHMLIQPKENIYFPGIDGTNTRILMCGETEGRAKDHLRVVEHHFEQNELLRGLWPHLVWRNPRKDSKKWNDTEMILPREQEYPDPSMRAIGVGGAVTGAHPNVLIKDDLTTEAAANSPVVMQTAIDWHVNSRALFSTPHTDLEFITCTRWAVADLPEYVMTQDHTVEVNEDWRQMIVDGQPIYPENFGQEGAVDALMKQFGTRFPLLYMNSVVDSQLVDFDVADLRFFRLEGETIKFHEDERDMDLHRVMNMPVTMQHVDLRGKSVYAPEVEREMLRKRIYRQRSY